MYPLNHYHDEALEKWLTNDPGRNVTVFQISSIFNESYMKACNPMNAINGCKKAGIVPYDPDVFSDIDFAAAEVTEQVEFEDIPQNVDVSSNNIIAAHVTPPEQVYQNEQLAIPSTSHTNLSQQDSILMSTVNEASVSRTSTSELSNSFQIFPKDVHPLPRISQEQRSKKTRKSAGTVILTSTPYKDQLVEEQQKKGAQEEMKALKMKNKQALKKCQGNNKKAPPTTNRDRKMKKQVEEDEESEVEDDVECLFCCEQFLQSAAGEDGYSASNASVGHTLRARELRTMTANHTAATAILPTKKLKKLRVLC